MQDGELSCPLLRQIYGGSEIGGKVYGRFLSLSEPITTLSSEQYGTKLYESES